MYNHVRDLPKISNLFLLLISTIYFPSFLDPQAEASDNQTEQLVKHVFKCLVSAWRQGGQEPVNFFRSAISNTPAIFC